MHKKYRIVSTPRFITFLVICGLLLIYAVSSFAGAYNAEGLTMTTYRQVYVSSGDTLWSIASECTPDDMDIRRAVDDICTINDISASDLMAGTTILVPEYIC